MQKKNVSPWSWIPSLYFTEGLPYIIVMSLSVIMYKRLGVSNADIALYTSFLYFPWVLKPFWSPFVDIIKTKRWWIVIMQVVFFIALLGVSFSLQTSSFFKISLVFFWLLAFSSATHDIAADGFYMIALDERKQAYFVGIRNTFYRLAMVTGQGVLVVLAGFLEKLDFFDSPEGILKVWSIVFCLVSFLCLFVSVFHYFIIPKLNEDSEKKIITIKELKSDFILSFKTYIAKKDFYMIIAFTLTYRLGESQLTKIASPFLLDERLKGGLQMSTSEVGFVYGTVGTIALVVGGLLGAYLCSRDGLKKWLWYMVLAINLPNLVYVYLSFVMPDSLFLIASSVVVEQFGYGFGFTAFMLYLIYISEGRFKTSHFAFSTGLMALGMMIPGMFSGIIQEFLSYRLFFIWVCISTIPSFLVVYYLNLDSLGLKK